MAISVGWGENWEMLANAINDYYGGGVSSAQYQKVAQMLNSGNYTMDEMESVLSQIPEFDRVYNANGELMSVTYKASATGNTASGAIANTVNSNAGVGANSTFKSVQNVTVDQSTGKATISDTVTKYNNGTATTAKTVMTSVGQAMLATGVGINVGKSISSLAYNVAEGTGYNWLSWAGVDMESLNPATWSNITAGDNSVGAMLFNMMLGIDPATGNPQAYADERAVAYMTAYMAQTGVFENKTSDLIMESVDANVGIPTKSFVEGMRINSSSNPPWYSSSKQFFRYYPSSGRATGWQHRTEPNRYRQLVASSNSDAVANGYMTETGARTNTVTGETIPIQNMAVDGWDNTPMTNTYTVYGKTVYYLERGGGYSREFDTYDPMLTIKGGYNDVISDDYGKIAWTMIYGTGGVDGFDSITGAQVFDPSGISDLSDIDEVLQALQDQYPDLWNNRIEMSPDGQTVINYIPIGLPTGGTGNQPTSEGADQNALAPDIKHDGQNATDALIKTLIDLITGLDPEGDMNDDTNNPDGDKPNDPNGDDSGSGNTPDVIIPVGSASALYAIYNPTQAQINSFGAWLWSPDFVDQILKLFNDPMQAIIGLHKVFASPVISGAGNIKVGYLDSGVGSNIVGAQYTQVDCGSVKLSEYFKNALDYLKTDVYLYLPFVGIVPLNVEDVMRATINVKYKVDVLSGACLASVNVTRDANAGGQLYAYAGNCAVQYPLSSGSYVGIISSALGIAGSIAGTVLSGGAMLPMALGVGASALAGAKTHVEHSGSFGGSAGAMGIKKPYLIIRRPQTKIVRNYNEMYGGVENVYGALSSFSGMTRVSSVHLENIPATNDELTEIENLLKSGVLI